MGALTTLAEPCTLTAGPIAAEHMGAGVDGKLHSLGPKDTTSGTGAWEDHALLPRSPNAQRVHRGCPQEWAGGGGT